MFLEGLHSTQQFIKCNNCIFSNCLFSYLDNNKPRREIIEKVPPSTTLYTLNEHMPFELLISIIYFQTKAYLNVIFVPASVNGSILYLIPLTLHCRSIFGALSISAVAWLSFSSSASALLDRT